MAGRDLKVDQLRFAKLIVSSSPGMIYSSSHATDFDGGNDVNTVDVGKDTFLFVSGVRGTRGTSRPGVILLDADIAISGATYTTTLFPMTNNSSNVGATDTRYATLYAAQAAVSGVQDAGGTQRIMINKASSSVYTATVADSATATGHLFNTSVSLTTTGSKLASFKNNESEKLHVDYNGKLVFNDTTVQGTAAAPMIMVFGLQNMTPSTETWMFPGYGYAGGGLENSAEIAVPIPFNSEIRRIDVYTASPNSDLTTFRIYKNSATTHSIILSGSLSSTFIAGSPLLSVGTGDIISVTAEPGGIALIERAVVSIRLSLRS